MKPIFRRLALATVLFAIPFVGACTVRPLLAKGPAGPSAPGGQSVAAALSSVEIEPVSVGADDARVTQRVRNELIFLLYGGASRSPDPRYTLKLKVTARESSAATIQRANEQQPTAEVMKLTADYVLLDRETGKKLASGRREMSSPYDVSRQEYAVYRAEIDAQNRAARELAEVLRLSIGQALSQLPSGG